MFVHHFADFGFPVIWAHGREHYRDLVRVLMPLYLQFANFSHIPFFGGSDNLPTLFKMRCEKVNKLPSWEVAKVWCKNIRHVRGIL